MIRRLNRSEQPQARQPTVECLHVAGSMVFSDLEDEFVDVASVAEERLETHAAHRTIGLSRVIRPSL